MQKAHQSAGALLRSVWRLEHQSCAGGSSNLGNPTGQDLTQHTKKPIRTVGFFIFCKKTHPPPFHSIEQRMFLFKNKGIQKLSSQYLILSLIHAFYNPSLSMLILALT